MSYISKMLTDNHVFQDLLDNNLSVSKDNLSENTNTTVSLISQIILKSEFKKKIIIKCRVTSVKIYSNLHFKHQCITQRQSAKMSTRITFKISTTVIYISKIPQALLNIQ